MSEEVFCLFRSFAEYILEDMDLRFGIPVWSEKKGWTYRIGKSGVYLITGIVIEKNSFVVDNIEVSTKEQLCLLFDYVKEMYRDNHEAFYAKIAEKNQSQKERTAKRILREKEAKEELKSKIIPEKYNIFRWPAKLDISKLNKLYQKDAKGIQDETLADDIGLTLYMRCLYGKEDMQRMENNIIRCHGCGAEIKGETDFRQCSCGLQYSYKEYRRSFRRNNMPTGAAAQIFNSYVQNWTRAKTYNEKILLIDSLLHAFHLSLVSGTVHRPVAMNFIDGSRENVEQIIKKLSTH